MLKYDKFGDKFIFVIQPRKNLSSTINEASDGLRGRNPKDMNDKRVTGIPGVLRSRGIEFYSFTWRIEL